MAARTKLKRGLYFKGGNRWVVEAGNFKFEFRQMLKTTREHCKKLLQVSID